MADPLTRRIKKWTYLTWCDLRNHPLMLVGCFLGALAFAFVYLQGDSTNQRVQGVERTVKVPRRCTVAHIPHTPSNVVILFCNPATKKEIAAAEKKKAARTARRKAATKRRARRRRTAQAPQGGPGIARPESPNGNPGIAPSPSHQQQPSSPSPSRPPSGGGSSPPTRSPPPARASPGLTTPQLGPIPSLTIPLPNPSLPPLPTPRQLTGR